MTGLYSKNGSIHEGIIYKDQESGVPYQLLDETEEGKIRGIHIENKLEQGEEIFKSRTFGTWFYHENVPLLGDPENRRYRDRKEFLDNHGHNSQ